MMHLSSLVSCTKHATRERPGPAPPLLFLAMQPKKTDQPAPDAYETEKATCQDGQPAPPERPNARGRVVRPDSDKGSGGTPPDEIEDLGDPPKMA